MFSYLALIGFCFLIVAIIFLIFNLRIIEKKAVGITFAISLFAMLIFNTYLTSLPIVMYNTKSILGVYISSFPVEDIGYLIASVLLVPALFEQYGKEQKK